MKEASSELSMTAIAVIAIAGIGVLFTTLIWPTIRDNILRSQRCAQAISCTNNGDIRTCEYCKDEACSEIGTVQCPSQGE